MAIADLIPLALFLFLVLAPIGIVLGAIRVVYWDDYKRRKGMK